MKKSLLFFLMAICTFSMAAQTPKPKLYVLSAGIKDYQSLKDLEFCEADARDVASKLAEQTDLYEVNKPVVLVGANASCRNIQVEIDNIKRQILALPEPERKDAFFVFFFSGHGCEGGVLAPWDFQAVDGVFSNSLTHEYLNGLFRGLPCRYGLILDACFSGGFVGKNGGEKDLVVDTMKFKENMMSLVAGDRSSFLMASSGSAERSWEDTLRKHGYLAQALLDCMDGKPHPMTQLLPGNQNGGITQSQFIEYVNTHIIFRTKKKMSPQTPYSSLIYSAPQEIFRYRSTGSPPQTSQPGQPGQPGQQGQPGQPNQPGQPGQPNQSGQPQSYTETVFGVSFKMVFVEGGTFTMGCTADCGKAGQDEWPVRSVSISNFHMGETEVTQALWRAVMGSNPSGFFGCDECPVENVSWEEAQSFIYKLNSITGKTYRLPSESEWEYAARGGAKGGSSPYMPDVAVYGTNKPDRVKRKMPNALGLYDIPGNVWEWCSDWYEKYQTNPGVEPDGTERVIRGGCFRDVADQCRSSNRDKRDPTKKYDHVGLRLAR
jgi:formylglycine-generating enzyme required for sulfatase activity